MSAPVEQPQEDKQPDETKNEELQMSVLREAHARGPESDVIPKAWKAHDERVENLKAAHGAAQETLGVAEGELQEALDLLEALIPTPTNHPAGTDDAENFLRRHGRLTEGDSQ